ncbi:hypothetical protein [Rufibacter sp. LB8]|uniref:hypothetical protein n=1 Tax=Rufibacter sp. LB8 TaxID=2777781 RepID=UPI00178C5FEB|nr:hypothetical protein [Rufibacter sp. LB8]
MKNNDKEPIQVQLFKKLIENDTDLEHLSQTLSDLYFEYSSAVIRLALDGDPMDPRSVDQLFWLKEIIHVLDPRASIQREIAA